MRLPESWVETTVGKIVLDLQPGFAQKPGEEDEGTTPQIRTHNVTADGRVILDGIKHISASAKELKRYMLTTGDIVFNNTNSEEWVGKTGVFNHEGEYVFSNHMTRLRANLELVCPEFLASYLHLLWSMGYSKTRAKRWVSQAGVETSALASFKVPLPTLPEQRRIVSVVSQASSVIKSLKSRREQLSLIINAALDRLVLAIDAAHWQSLGTLIDTRYGTSVSADSDIATGTPVLRIPNVMGGEVSTSDLKYVELSKAELDRLRLTNADVLIVRSNGNPDYVGRSAPITNDLAGTSMVYASYLIRLRADTSSLLPEYLSAFLNSAYGRAAMRNAIRTTAGQSNLSGENLTKVRIPLPSLADQESFKRTWDQVKRLRALLAASEATADQLRRLVTVEAISGDLTEEWRSLNSTEIAAAALGRDQLLRERGVRIDQQIEELEPPAGRESLKSKQRPRDWLSSELSEFQRQVLASFEAYPEQPVLVEDPDMFARFCDNPEVQRRLRPFGSLLNNRIRRTLSQLAASGLIAKITLPKLDMGTGESQYIKAFRPLREAEYTRWSDLEAIRLALSPGTDEKRYFLSAHLDYGDAARTQNGVTFQVISVVDGASNDFTHLIRRDSPYTSIDELKEDIAEALNVTLRQVELEEI
jgi:type I restriction enzyme S subunit